MDLRYHGLREDSGLVERLIADAVSVPSLGDRVKGAFREAYEKVVKPVGIVLLGGNLVLTGCPPGSDGKPKPKPGPQVTRVYFKSDRTGIDKIHYFDTDNPSNVQELVETSTFAEGPVVVGNTMFYINATNSLSRMDLPTMVETDLGIQTLYFDVSPNGNEAVYATGGVIGGAIEVADSTTGNFLRQLTSGNQDREPNYSKPTGNQVFFARDVGPSYEIFKINSGGGSPTQITTPVPSGGRSNPVPLSNGRVAYTKNYFTGSDVMVMDEDGSNGVNLTNTSSIYDLVGSESPGGSRLFIVTTRYTASNDPEIASILIDGSDPIRYTTSTAWDDTPYATNKP